MHESEVSHKLLSKETELRELESRATGVTRTGIDKNVYELSKQGLLLKEPVSSIIDTLKTVDKYIDELKKSQHYDIASTAYTFRGWSDNLKDDFKHLCKDERVPGIGNFYRCPTFDPRYYSYQKAVSENIGKCGFIQEGTNPSPITALDSFTNCMHTYAIHMATPFEENNLCSGRITSHKEDIYEFCNAFSEAVEENEDGYQMCDQGYQRATVHGGIIDVQVGGEPSHRTKISLDDGVIVYEDHYPPRVDVVRETLEEIGLECDSTSSYRTACRSNDGFNKEDLDRIARLLSTLPSMDIYIKDNADERFDDALESAQEEFSEEIHDRAKELSEEWAIDDTVPCLTDNISRYVKTGKPKLPDIVEVCFY